MRLLHNSMALCVLGALILGFYIEIMPKGWKYVGWRLHKSLGITVLLLLPLRIWFRYVSALPLLPGISAKEHVAAKIVHHLLYVAMLLMVGSGYTMVAAKGKAIVWFGLTLPSVMPVDPGLAKLARQWHEPFAYFLLVLLALHMLALLKHKLIDKTNLLPRMF